MDIELIKTLVYFFSALAGSAILMCKFRHFLYWKKSDTWATYLARAIEENKQDKLVHNTMFFDSMEKTFNANMVNFVFLGLTVLIAFQQNELLTFIDILYITVGFVFTRKIANSLKTENHHRLFLPDKFWFKLYFAVLWPVYFSSNKTQK
ncbi:hypothetical protein AAKU58_003959 [Oxalobacteraceae bacterium GrIS 1.18]